jgi:hypothetical protein
MELQHDATAIGAQGEHVRVIAPAEGTQSPVAASGMP